MTPDGVTGLLRRLRDLSQTLAAREMTDGDLLQRYLATGDMASFSVLLVRHGPMVWRVSWRLLGRREDVEDAFQACFLLMAQRAGSIRNRHSVGGWLHGVAYRVARTIRRSRSRTPATPPPVEVPGVPDQVSAREVKALLHEELDRLPERLRAPLVLCFLEDQTQEAAAHQLGCSLSTLKRWLDRGRDVLRRRLVRRGVTWGGILATGLLADTTHAAVPATLRVVTEGLIFRLHANPECFNIPPNVEIIMKNVPLGVTPLIKKIVTCLSVSVVMALSFAVYQAFATPTEPTANGPNPPFAQADPPAKDKEQAKPRPIHVLQAPIGAASFLAFTKDGAKLVSGGSATNQPLTVQVWDVKTGKMHSDKIKHPISARAIALLPDDKSVATGNTKDEIAIWDLESGKQMATANLNGASSIQTLSVNFDGKSLAAVDGRDELTLWDLPQLKSHKLTKAHTERCWTVTFHPKVRIVATASWDGLIKFWDMESLQCRAVIESTLKLDPTGKNPTHHNSIAFSPDGKWLAAGGYEGTVEVWDVSTHQAAKHAFAAADFKKAIPVSNAVISTVAFSPDGKLLATASWDKTVRLYRTDTSKLVATFPIDLEGHDHRVLSLAFDPKGSVLAAGSLNGAIRLWPVPFIAKQEK